MIQLDSISRSFGQRTLFADLSWNLGTGRRIGLVGPNGSGKTTLFRILAGDLEPDTGRVVRPSGCTIGLLAQEVGDLGDAALLEFVLEGRADLLEAERDMERVAAEIADGPDHARLERLTRRLGELEETLRREGGYELRARAREILSGMGFRAEQFEQPTAILSGGWKVRAVLSRLLLQRPSVLLMDEPTNHLDLPSVEWLEGFLQTYEGTVVIISHDRYFLNRLINETAAFEPDGFAVYEGDYDSYVVARAERLDLLERQKAQQDRSIKETERFIERFRSKATKARQVQSRVKQLEKLERIELPGERRAMRGFHFEEAGRPGRDVCVVDGVAKAFGDNVVYSDVSVTIERGEKVALVGPNGAGKTTLLRMMMGLTRPDAGQISLGHNVIAGYFGQHQVDELDLSRTILEEMQAHATTESAPRCRSILGAFLFSGDDVQKRISVLSGGERNRTALAKLLLKPSNLLLLDEPTNHLDMESRDILQRALNGYGGTIVFVSHDRHFINAIATRVVHVEAGRLADYPGDYEYYHYKRAQERAEREAEAAAEAASNEAERGAAPNRRDQRRRDAEIRQELARVTKRPRRKLEEVEVKIAALEDERDGISQRLADPALYDGAHVNEIATLQQRQRDIEVDLAWLMPEWEKQSLELDEIERQVRAKFEA